jgi:hypothetical protein
MATKPKPSKRHNQVGAEHKTIVVADSFRFFLQQKWEALFMNGVIEVATCTLGLSSSSTSLAAKRIFIDTRFVMLLGPCTLEYVVDMMFCSETMRP